MGFFVVGRSTDGLLEMLGSQEYETREDAARGIQTLALAGTIDVGGRDVYIVDMAGAAPVVIVGVAAAPAAEPVEEEQPAAGAWETTDETAAVAHDETEVAVAQDVELVEGSDVEMAEETPEEPVEETAAVAAEDDLAGPMVAETETPSDSDAALEYVAGVLDEEAAPDLAAALKRAATSLEDEGIVAPESIGPAEASEEDASASEEDLSDVIAALTMPTGGNATPDAEQTPTQETTEWPWANVGEVATDAEGEADSDETQLAEDADEDELLAEALEAAVAVDSGDDMLIVQSAAFGDDPFAPRAVIMGDYDETTAVVAADEPDAPVEAETVDSGTEVTTDEAEPDLPEIASLPGAYEMSGDLELGSYTCEDCVYSNTCPKVGQSTPDECGAFQWKAV